MKPGAAISAADRSVVVIVVRLWRPQAIIR
jgi:hypothetical protein